MFSCDIELEIREKAMNMTKIWLVKLVRDSKLNELVAFVYVSGVQ